MGPVSRGLRAGTVQEALEAEPWSASAWTQEAECRSELDLDTVMDCEPGAAGSDLVRDEPISFDPQRREYGWRSVRYRRVRVQNPTRVRTAAVGPAHDPFSAWDED